MGSMYRFILILLYAIAATTHVDSGTAMAADTTEAFDVGASDVDLYLGYDGVGFDNDERSISGEVMLGYGIVDNISAFAGAARSGSETFESDSTTTYFGLFGTVVESDHVDVDVYACFSGEDADRSYLAVTPGLELNLDRAADLKSWGVYLNGAFPVFGRKTETAIQESAKTEVAVIFENTTGAYLTISDGHQLLLEFDMIFLPDPPSGQRGVQVGALAFGYNLYLVDALELINQISLDIPQGGETASIGIMIGLIATLPTGAPTGAEKERS